MNVPDDLRYSETHEWLRLEGDIATIGITDHAQAELTEVVYVEPPKVGSELKSGQVAAVVESVKAASDIYSPVSGSVIESNAALESDPGLLNRDPFGEGWIYRLKLASTEEVDALKTPEAYGKQIASSGK